MKIADFVVVDRNIFVTDQHRWILGQSFYDVLSDSSQTGPLYFFHIRHG
jgi:hypothetical protein